MLVRPIYHAESSQRPPPPATSLTPRRRFLHELHELTQPPPSTSAYYRNVLFDFGKNRRLLEKWRSKIGFYFFTYEWSRRRLPSIKTNNEGEEVFALLFSALDDDYLFWKYRDTRFKSEGMLFNWRFDWSLGTQRQKGRQTKKTGEKNQQKSLGFVWGLRMRVPP